MNQLGTMNDGFDLACHWLSMINIGAISLAIEMID